MNRIALSISIFGSAFFFLTACQKNEIPQDTYNNMGNPVVQAADGTSYSVDCLRTQASEIQSKGSKAMKPCAVNLNNMSVNERGKFFNKSYAWIYNPTVYLHPSYYSYSYPSNYNWIDSSFQNNSFCGFVFGNNTSFNCYYLLGYLGGSSYTYSNNNYNNWSSNYQQSCGYTSCVYKGICNLSCYSTKWFY